MIFRFIILYIYHNYMFISSFTSTGMMDNFGEPALSEMLSCEVDSGDQP